MNQKDVSLAHLKALLEASPFQSSNCDGGCLWCHDNPHATNCVYVQAQDHVNRLNDERRSELLKNVKPSRPRFEDTSMWE